MKNSVPIENGEERDLALREIENLQEFVEESKRPALVIGAIDTVPDADGRYRVYRTAIGMPDAVVATVAWLHSQVIPEFEGNDSEDVHPTEREADTAD